LLSFGDHRTGLGLHHPEPQLGSGIATAFDFGGAHSVVRNSTAANKAIVFFTVQSPFKVELHRDNVLLAALLPDNQRNVFFPKAYRGRIKEMTLNSALEDLRATTLKAISGSLRKLEYLAGLRDSSGAYAHWGLERVHGELAASRAIEEEHRQLLSRILSTPVQRLLVDVEESSERAGMSPAGYVECLIRDRRLLPPQPGAGAERHLNSVLQALSNLAHSNPDDLAYHIRFLGISEHSGRHGRQGVGLQNNLFSYQTAPGTNVPLAGFHEVDRALIFRPPPPSRDNVFRLIHLHESSGRKNGIHGQIFTANVPVGEFAAGKLRQIR
jgi:hypothetical protein